MTEMTGEVLAQIRGQVGCITLNRPKALNALSLGMVRDLMTVLLEWQRNPAVLAVAIRGSNKEGVFGAFCAGGDIRFLHQAGSSGNPEIEDFFTEEYALNHLIHTYLRALQGRFGAQWAQPPLRTLTTYARPYGFIYYFS